jgi:hypothetical protein
VTFPARHLKHALRHHTGAGAMHHAAAAVAHRAAHAALRPLVAEQLLEHVAPALSFLLVILLIVGCELAWSALHRRYGAYRAARATAVR